MKIATKQHVYHDKKIMCYYVFTISWKSHVTLSVITMIAHHEMPTRPGNAVSKINPKYLPVPVTNNTDNKPNNQATRSKKTRQEPSKTA